MKTKKTVVVGVVSAVKSRAKIFAGLLLAAGLLGGTVQAQLLHRYNFYTGTANDTVGSANGTLEGTATISGGALNTDGGLGNWTGGAPTEGVMLDASAVTDITNAFTIETWFIANYVSGGYSTLFAFSDGTTANYVLATPARGNSPYASGVAVVGGGGSTTEQQAGGIYLDNGGFHDMMITFDGTNLTYYLDGTLAPVNPISSVPTSFTDAGLNLSTLTDIAIAGGSPWSDHSMSGKTFDFRIYGQTLTAAQVAAIYGLGTNAANAAISTALVPASAYTWDGGGADSNWSTGGNWAGSVAPATAGDSVTFAGSTGTAPNLNKNYSVTGLTFSNNASSFTLGTTSNTLTLAGDVINNSASAQTLDVPLALGVAANLNAAAGGFVVNSNITLGASALKLVGSGNFALNGVVAGTGSFTMNGAGALTLGGAGLSAGDVSFNNGTSQVSGSVASTAGTTYVGYLTNNAVVNKSSGTWNIGGEIRVGGSDQNGSAIVGTGILNVSSGAVYASALTLARGNYLDNTMSGTLTLSGGSTFVSTNDVVLQFAGGGLGKLEILNGSTFVAGPNATKWFMVGYYDGGAGELDITNGNLLLENGASIKMCRSGNTGANVINQVGGAVTFYSDSGVTVGGGGNLDVNYAGGSSSSSTYNLQGGILTVPEIIASSSSGSGVFEFNGGILKPTASTATFMQGLTAANVMVGGAIIDTTNLNITIAQDLVNGDGLTGGLTKLGSGTLTLTGGAGYAGPTIIEGGIVAVDASQSFTANALTVSNATLTLSLNNGSSSLSAANVKFIGSTVLNLNYGTATSPTAPAIAASGYSVSNTGTNVINITGQNLETGEYQIILTGSSVSTANFKLGTLPTGMTAVLTNSGSSLDLLVTGAGQVLNWYGADSAGDALTVWNINTSSNWNTGAAKYLQYQNNSYGDNVIFNDALYSAADAAITLNAAVVPASVTFDNNSTAYSLTGSGSIGGVTSVAMNGTSITYLGTTNTYTGGTTIGAGTLSVSGDGALGASTAAVTLLGGTLQFSNTTTSPRSLVVVSNSTIDLPGSPTVQLSGTISGGAALTKTGTGTLIIAGADDAYSTLVGAGTVSLVGAATNDAFTVGSVAGNSMMNISGTLVASNLFVGNIDSAVAAVTQTGGSVYLNGGTGDTLNLGNWANSFGYYNAAGGTMNINGISIGGEENPDVWPPVGSGDGILEVNGATINNSGWIVLSRGSGPNLGILNVYSGSLTYAGGGVGCNWEQTDNSDQTAIINLLGGSVTSTNEGVNFRTVNTGIVNLNGGVLEGTSVTGYGVLNFNGGTLEPCAGFTSPFVSLSAAYVYSGGAKFNDNGQSVTLTQPLLAPTGYGVSSLVPASGSSGYIAPPIVTLSGGTGSNATAIATISGGAVSRLIVTCPGTGYSSSDTLTVTYSDGGSSAVAPASTTVSLAANTSGGLIKTGTGTLALDSVNTYVGPTLVNAGTLAGTGTIAGALTNNAILAPGSGASGALTVLGNITLTAGSTNVFDVNGTTPTNASVVAGASVSYGGVLEIVPSGTFTLGQQFQLFSGSGAASASNFASVQGSAGSGLGFAFTNGVLTVVTASTIPSTPTNIVFSVTGNNTLGLSWPASYLGWILQEQTNSLAAGLGTNWVDVAGSADLTSTNITVNVASPAVFYRLRHP